MEIIKLKEIDSTNEYAKKLIDSGKRDFIVIADKQSKGRGRLGRVWFSDPGGLYFSIVLDNKFYEILSFITPLSVVKALNIGAKIKFPNDVIYRDKKISGILIERYKDKIIVGVGINVENEIRGEIKDIAISLKDIKRGVNKDEVFKRFLDEFFNYYNKFANNDLDKEAILKEYKKFSDTIGKRVKLILPNNEVEGLVFNIDFEGISLVTDVGLKKYPTGEIKNLRNLKEWNLNLLIL